MPGFAVIVVTLIAAFAFTKWCGRVLGVSRELSELIAAGTSICGASAIIAANTVTHARDDDVAYAVACVTVFGSLAMLLYPLVPGLLHLDARAFGLWSGASIHEIAQVIAAAFQAGSRAGEFGTVAKLTRVMMLAPMVISLGMIAALKSTGGDAVTAKAPMPWLVLGFIAVMLINITVMISPSVKSVIVSPTTFVLSMALAAMGLETDVRKLKAEGWTPIVLAALSWQFIAGFSLALVKLIAYS